ncbi:hypothetical protein FOZ60_016140 [Perkinsus olseni]|uniref:Uncharacterized protein n=1 Tax=Perkinsus olseni TaxID=32597 RepID=A0A7J6P538_PEROL|nr:hypothetical protein FOZ60_016140 [Perkinsus olseni]
MGHIVCGRLDGSRMTLPVRRHQRVRSVATTGSVTACGFEDGSLWVLGALNEGDPKHCSVIGRFKPGKADNAVRSRNRAFYDLPLKRRGLTELVISESEQFVAGVDGARCQIVIFKIVTTTVREFGEGSELAEFIAGKIFGLSSPSAAQKPVGKTKTSVVLWSFVDLPQVAEELELALHFGGANTLLVCGLNGNASRYAYDPSVCGEKATLVWSSQLCPLRERSASSDTATSTTTVGGNSYRDADTPSTRLGAATHWDVDGQVITFGVNEDASGINEAREESPTKASEDEWIVIAESVLLTGRGAAVARPAQSQAAPPAPPSGPFPLRNRVPRNWKSTETGCTLLSFCCWFLGGKDIARARATCKMMLAKLEMGEIVEIAKSRGIRVTSVVMNGKEVKPTTAQLLRAMYRLETVYIEETFTTSDWGKKWLRGPLSVDEQNQAVDLRECKVVEMTKNSDEENDAGDPSSPCPPSSSKCLTILGPVNRACYPYSGLYLHTIRQNSGVKPRRSSSVQKPSSCARDGGLWRSVWPCGIQMPYRWTDAPRPRLSRFALDAATTSLSLPGASSAGLGRVTAHTQRRAVGHGGSVHLEPPPPSALCPVASAFVVGFMENGISATGCPAWAYEPRKWYHIAVDFKWPSLERCSCRNKRDRIHDSETPCELAKSDLYVTFWINGQLVRKDARVAGDSRLLHNGFVACCLYNNSGHKAVPTTANSDPKRNLRGTEGASGADDLRHWK